MSQPWHLQVGVDRSPRQYPATLAVLSFLFLYTVDICRLQFFFFPDSFQMLECVPRNNSFHDCVLLMFPTSNACSSEDGLAGIWERRLDSRHKMHIPAQLIWWNRFYRYPWHTCTFMLDVGSFSSQFLVKKAKWPRCWCW